MALSLDGDLRAHLENHLAPLVAAYVENKLKRFGLYRRTTIHTGTTVAQRTFGDKIKCIDTLLRESGKLLVSKLPITALSRDETYEIHLKEILKSEWSTYGILVVDSRGQKHRDFYITAFLGVADVRTSVQKIYHKSRLEMYEELQNVIKIMPSVNGRRPCCSKNNSEELYRLNNFASHMSLMKDLFCVESGLDPRSFQKNEDGPYRHDPSYSPSDPRYDICKAPYGPWENLVQSLNFLVSDEASCMRMVHDFYTSKTGRFDFLVSYLNENAERGKFVSDIYHHPAMAVLELLRVAGPDINLLGEGNAQSGGSLCPIDFFFKEVGINLIATITFFLQKMVLFGGTINGETTLKEFFYPESGIYRFKPGEGLSRCTRYVTEDLRGAFPSVTEGKETKFSVVSRRRFQMIALLSKFFTATRDCDPELNSQPIDHYFDLRGSSVDFDPDALSAPQINRSGDIGCASKFEGQRAQGLHTSLYGPPCSGQSPKRTIFKDNEDSKNHSDSTCFRHDNGEGVRSSNLPQVRPQGPMDMPLERDPGYGRTQHHNPLRAFHHPTPPKFGTNYNNNSSECGTNNVTTSTYGNNNTGNRTNIPSVERSDGCRSDRIQWNKNNISNSNGDANSKRLQAFGNFQTNSKPVDPSSERAVAVVLASIKDSFQSLPATFNSDGLFGTTGSDNLRDNLQEKDTDFKRYEQSVPSNEDDIGVGLNDSGSDYSISRDCRNSSISGSNFNSNSNGINSKKQHYTSSKENQSYPNDSGSICSYNSDDRNIENVAVIGKQDEINYRDKECSSGSTYQLPSILSSENANLSPNTSAVLMQLPITNSDDNFAVLQHEDDDFRRSKKPKILFTGNSKEEN